VLLSRAKSYGSGPGALHLAGYLLLAIADDDKRQSKHLTLEEAVRKAQQSGWSIERHLPEGPTGDHASELSDEEWAQVEKLLAER